MQRVCFWRWMRKTLIGYSKEKPCCGIWIGMVSWTRPKTSSITSSLSLSRTSSSADFRLSSSNPAWPNPSIMPKSFHHARVLIRKCHIRELNREVYKCSKEAVGPFQPVWEIEELRSNGAYRFFHRSFIENLIPTTDQTWYFSSHFFILTTLW